MAGLHFKLQVFASDVDPDAIALARDGLYPDTIEAEVTPARLARFFSKEGRSCRVRPELRVSPRSRTFWPIRSSAGSTSFPAATC